MTYSSEVLTDSPSAYYRLGDRGFPSEVGIDDLVNTGSATQHDPGPLASSYAVTLNGTSQYLSSAYDINASQFTIEAWIKTTDTAGTIADDRGSSGQSLTLAMGPAPVGGSGNGQIWFGVNGSGLAGGIATTGTYNDGNWHHVVGVWSGTSGTAVTSSQLVIYVDGVAASTSAISSYGSANAPLIGSGGYVFGNGSPGYFAGSLSRIALYSGVALTSTRVAAHYAATTVSGYSSAVLADSPIAYWTLDQNPVANGQMTDSGGSARNGTYGGSIALGQTGLLVGDADTSVAFTAGSGTVAYDAAWLSAATFSAEAWFSFPNVSGTKTVMSRYGASGFASSRWSLRADNAALTLYTFSGGSFTTMSVATISANTTYHAVVTFDGTTARVYLNGSLAASATRAMNAATTDFYVGVGGGTEYAVGKVDEVAYYPTVLSSTRVSAHYTAGTSTPGASGTASLSLSATGGASAASAGTASLSLSASGGTSAAAAGTASLNLSAVGDTVAPSPASGTASLSLSASGASVGAAAGAASLSLAATGAALATLAASGTAALTLSASGSAVMSSGGTASLTLSANGVAIAVYTTDLSNAFDGLDVVCVATVTLTYAPAPVPPSLVPAAKYDKAVPYPVPVMVGGRPT